MSSQQRWRQLVTDCEAVIEAIQRAGGCVPPGLRDDYALAVQTVKANRHHLDHAELGLIPVAVAVVGWGIGLAATAYAGWVLSKAAGEVSEAVSGGTRHVIAQASRAAGLATYALVGLGVFWVARRVA